MPLAPGATFAGYSIIRMLGTGGIGEVYLARHPTLARDDALKVLPRAMTADREFRARFKRESESVATLYHPNIVQTYDRGEFEGRLWIAMEYVQGTDVAKIMREQFPAGMPAGEALAIVTAVAGALEYAHRRGVQHRDVRPANIFLTDDGGQRIRLTDFGVARPLDAAGRRTATNLTAATVAYAAPEQFKGSHIDGRADQYGLAATAFHLLTGSPPYEDSDPATVVSQHRTAVPPRLGDRHPELARLDDVLSKGLAKDADDRFASCQEFADALNGQAWAGDRSPEAYLNLVDYPDEAAPKAGVGDPVQIGRHSTGSRSALTTWLRHKRAWIVLGSVTGAALLLLTGVLVGLVVGQKEGNKPAQAAGPPTRPTTAGPASSPPAAAPTPSVAARPGPGELLNGVYQLDMNRAQETYNDYFNPQPPDITTWWAFRSSCTPAGCVADGIEVDGKDHRVAKPSIEPVVLDFRNGAWQSRPVTVPFACVGQNGKSGQQSTRQVLTLQPHGNGPLRGDMTIDVESNECGQQGAKIVIPAVAGRTGGVPPGVAVPPPPPPTTTPAAPITTTPTR
jgi:serine/threonine-protein kinase